MEAGTEALSEMASDVPPAGAPPLLVIVVDTLDKCNLADKTDFVLVLLSQTSGLAVAALCILVTSWPKIPICKGLLGMPDSACQLLVLYHIKASIVSQDITTFIERSFPEAMHHGLLLPCLNDKVVLWQLEQRAEACLCG